MSENTLYENADAILSERVFVPAFFEKLASYGIAPQSAKEAEDMLRLADKLQYVDRAHAKQAGVGSLVERASRQLDEVLGLQPDAPAVKAAAASLVNDPLLRDAALLRQDALAQQLAS